MQKIHFNPIFGRAKGEEGGGVKNCHKSGSQQKRGKICLSHVRLKMVQ